MSFYRLAHIVVLLTLFFSTPIQAREFDIDTIAEEVLASIFGESDLKRQDELFPRPEGFGGLLITGLGYDDNIATSVEEGQSTSLEVSDEVFLLSGTFSYDWLFSNNLYAGLHSMAISNYYEDEGRDYDLGLFQGGVHVGVVGNNWDFNLNYEHDYVYFSHDKTRESSRVKGKFSIMPSTRQMLTVLGSYSNDDYTGNDSSDSNKVEIKISNMLYLPELSNGSNLKLSYKHQNNDANSVDSSYFYNKALIGLHYVLPWWDLYIYPQTSYEIGRYEDKNPDRRSDKIWERTLTFGKKWTEELSAEASIMRTSTHSNIDLYDKYQDVVGINLLYSF